MVAIDLKPLTEDVIQEMGYNAHDLWMVKIDSIVFGPYETESLKHYVHDNEHLFETAEASRADETEWKPFWAHTKFQRRKPQLVSGEAHEGPFWLMHAGLKVGPFAYREIDKKIEMDLLGMTDHISVDNGDTWVKIYEIAGFDRRSHAPEELPVAPSESSFQKAKLAVIEKVEEAHLNTPEVLAELAWEAKEAGKVIQFKVDEMTLVQQKGTLEVAQSMKWAVPTAAAVLVTLLASGYFMMNPDEEAVDLALENTEKPFYQKGRIGENKKSVRGAVPTPSFRAPSSVGYNRPNTESRYPTHVETHDQFQEPPEHNQDPVEGPATEEQQPQEHSLVTSGSPEENSIDAAMNGGVPTTEQPVVEEASDF